MGRNSEATQAYDLFSHKPVGGTIIYFILLVQLSSHTLKDGVTRRLFALETNF